MKRRRWVWAALLVMAATASCGLRTAVPDSEVAATREAAPVAPAAVPSPDAPTAGLAAAGDAASGPVEADPDWNLKEQEAAFGTRDNHNRTVRVRVAKPCVRHGELQRVEVQVPPGGNVNLIVGYRDAQPHGAMHLGTSDAEGHYVWDFVVAASAPPGEAIVLASSGGDPETGQGSGTAHARFRVASPQGC